MKIKMHIEQMLVLPVDSGELRLLEGSVIGDLSFSSYLHEFFPEDTEGLYETKFGFKDSSGKLWEYTAIDRIERFLPGVDTVVCETEHYPDKEADFTAVDFLRSNDQLTLNYSDGHTESLYLDTVKADFSIYTEANSCKVYIHLEDDGDDYMVHYTIDWKRFFGLNGSRYFEKYLEIQESEHPKIYAIDSLVSDLNPSSSVEFRQF